MCIGSFLGCFRSKNPHKKIHNSANCPQNPLFLGAKSITSIAQNFCCPPRPFLWPQSKFRSKFHLHGFHRAFPWRCPVPDGARYRSPCPSQTSVCPDFFTRVSPTSPHTFQHPSPVTLPYYLSTYSALSPTLCHLLVLRLPLHHYTTFSPSRCTDYFGFLLPSTTTTHFDTRSVFLAAPVARLRRFVALLTHPVSTIKTDIPKHRISDTTRLSRSRFRSTNKPQSRITLF
jgi:hypothetical protein